MNTRTTPSCMAAPVLLLAALWLPRSACSHPVHQPRLSTQAQEEVEKARSCLTADPDDFPTAMNYVWWLTAAGHLDEAERMCREAVALPWADPGEVSFALAEVALAEGDAAAAIDAMREAVRQTVTMEAFGRLSERLGDVESYYHNRREAQQGYRDSLVGLRLNLGRNDAVRRICKLASSGRSRDCSLLLAVASILSYGDGLSKAHRLQALEAVEPAYEEFPLLQLVLAHELQVAGDEPAALAAAQRAVELDPTSPAARRTLGERLEQQLDIPRAIEQYEAMAAVAPQFADVSAAAHLRLSDLYKEMGRMDAALQSYMAALAPLGAGVPWRLERLASLALMAHDPQKAMAFIDAHREQLPGVEVEEGGPVVEDWRTITGVRAALYAAMRDPESMRTVLLEGAEREQQEGEPAPEQDDSFERLLHLPPPAASRWLISRFASD